MRLNLIDRARQRSRLVTAATWKYHSFLMNFIGFADAAPPVWRVGEVEEGGGERWPQMHISEFKFHYFEALSIKLVSGQGSLLLKIVWYLIVDSMIFELQFNFIYIYLLLDYIYICMYIYKEIVFFF